MKIRELKDEPLIKRLPVDNDSYDRVLPDNRIKVARSETQPAQPTDVDGDEIERMKKLAGLTLGSGNDKGTKDSPLTHGGSDKGAYQQKHRVEPGTDEWLKLWGGKPLHSKEDPYGRTEPGTISGLSRAR